MTGWTKPVFSSNIKSVGWDEDMGGMLVEWNNGRTSLYEGVDEGTALSVANAPSVGSVVHNSIKPSYQHKYVR